LSFREHLGIGGTLLPGLATGFGGGMGRKGSLCGALTGAVLLIGIRIGRSDAQDRDRREKAYGATYRFWDRFEREFGSTVCNTLTGCRMDDAEDRGRWLTAGGAEKCAEMVEGTAAILFDFLDEITAPHQKA
jgi:C_GCAxxG_C_C family probable redox protein